MRPKFTSDIVIRMPINEGEEVIFSSSSADEPDIISDFDLSFAINSSSSAPDRTSLRLDNKTMWTLEVIRRMSRKFGGSDFKTYGRIISSLIAPYLKKRTILREKEDSDNQIISIPVPIELKRISRVIYVGELDHPTGKILNPELVECSLVDLTWDPIQVFRTLRVCLIEPENLLPLERKQIEWIIKGDDFIEKGKYDPNLSLRDNLLDIDLNFFEILRVFGYASETRITILENLFKEEPRTGLLTYEPISFNETYLSKEENLMFADMYLKDKRRAEDWLSKKKGEYKSQIASAEEEFFDNMHNYVDSSFAWSFDLCKKLSRIQGRYSPTSI